MAESRIRYDRHKHSEAGFLELKQGSKPLLDCDRKTLLNLLFWLTYTEEGRTFLSNNRTRDGKNSVEEVEANLRRKFKDDFGIIDEALLDALIKGHLAADRWVGAHGRMPSEHARSELAHQERVYQHNIAFVMWSLWEDAMAHDFSMNW